jgi:sulfur-oxidizing protein SoxZ
MSTIKLRTKLKGDKCSVKALMMHPMETGRRKDKKGQPIPAHHITTVECLHNGNLMMEADWGGGISENPYFAVVLNGVAKGDTIEVKWTDNKGESASGSTEVK